MSFFLTAGQLRTSSDRLLVRCEQITAQISSIFQADQGQEKASSVHSSFWSRSPRARQRRQRVNDEKLRMGAYLLSSAAKTPRTTAETILPIRRKTSDGTHRPYDLSDNNGSRLRSRLSEKFGQDTPTQTGLYRHRSGPRVSRVLNAEKPLEHGNHRIKSPTRPDGDVSARCSSGVQVRRMSRVLPADATSPPQSFEPKPAGQVTPRVSRISVIQLPRKSSATRASSIERKPRDEHSTMKKRQTKTVDTQPKQNLRSRAASFDVTKLKRSVADECGTQSGLVAGLSGIVEKVPAK